MTKKVKIDGMSCMHCVGRVKNGLLALEGVTDVTVDLEAGTATIVLSQDLADSLLIEAIDEAGYDAVVL